MAELNEDQRKAAEFVAGICAVIAVPGSGKTLTMVERIKNLVTVHQIPPETVLTHMDYTPKTEKPQGFP